MMELFKLAIALGLYSLAAADDDFVYLESRNSSYKYIHTRSGFAVKEIDCQMYGGNIWIPSSGEEAAEVLHKFQSEDFDFVWVGISKIDELGQKELLDFNGRGDFYRDWDTSNTTVNHSPQVAVKMNKQGKYSLSDVDERIPAICVKKEKNMDMDITDDFVYHSDFEASYKVYHIDKKPLFEDAPYANLKCLLDGAKLWVPESKEEVEAIFNSIVPEHAVSLVGILNYNNSGYMTTDGRRDYYVSWFGQPNDDHRHTAVFGYGLYKSGIPYELFVCKRNVEKPKNTHYAYNKKMDTFFKVHLDKKNFEDAGKQCEDEGASSLMLTNVDELRMVYEAANVYSSLAWFGFRKLGPSQYITTDGEHYKFQEKFIKFDEGCGLVHIKDEFSVTTCDAEYPFICQVKGKSLEFQNSPTTGIRYLYVPYPLTWYEAIIFCNNRDSSLVTFGSRNETFDVIELLSSKMTTSFIGYFKMNGSKRIVPLKGFHAKALERMEWVKKPDLDQFCVGMTKNGILIALNCNESRSFICKKTKNEFVGEDLLKEFFEERLIEHCNNQC